MTQSKTNRANDLRAFIEDLRTAGDLREISGADWNLEIGAIPSCWAKKKARRFCSTTSWATRRAIASFPTCCAPTGARRRA